MDPGNTFRGISRCRTAIAIAILISSVHPLAAQQDSLPRTSVSAAFGMLFYQSGFGVENTTGVELTIGRTFREQFRMEAGTRLGLDPVRTDFYLRAMATQRFGNWKPSVGIENGWSDRAFYEGDSELLRETRDAMTDDMGHWYVSSHIEPLCFGLKNHWDISVAEVDIGTHYQRFGSTVRANVNLLRIRRSF